MVYVHFIQGAEKSYGVDPIVLSFMKLNFFTFSFMEYL